MKRIMVLSLLIFLVLKSPAQILIYNCSVKSTGASLGNEFTFLNSGKLFYDWATTNFIQIMVEKQSKTYSVITSSNAVATTIQGKAGRTFTAFPAIFQPQSSTFFGPTTFPGIGLNSSLTIGSNKTVVFPRTFNYQSQFVSYSGLDNTSFNESTFTCVFSIPATQSANRSGQSINDAANAMINSLESAGYGQN